MLEQISWVFTVIALYGTYLNTQRDVAGYYYWIVSNGAFFAINLACGHTAQAFLFGTYVVLAVIGIKQWTKKCR